MPDHLVRSKPSKPPKVLRPTGKPRKKAAVRKPAARAAPEAHAKADGYIPFRERFRAWWHGVEPAAVVKKGQKAKTTYTKRLIELDDKEDLPPQADWGAARTRVCDQIWGRGYIGPGEGNYVVDTARPFSKRPESLVLDLSAGLGGRIEEIARDPDVTITGMERDPEFADVAAERVKQDGRRNIRPVTSYTPERLDLAGLKYDCILAREDFFSVEDKLALLGTLRNGLRQKGCLAFTDFVLAEADQNEGEVMREWHQTEPLTPKPWSLDEYRNALEGLNLNVVEFEDDSDYFRELVLHAWRRYVDSLETVSFDRTLVDALMGEAQLWLHRLRAIESGQLRVLRAIARAR
ncbi:MAG: class I SAM-dependent methyltransferase [Rhodospirillaceae bacterium]|nr:class I SAM-dependent methyltransferase [Rhodospirillaceae bacterium]MDD9917178.1 class I SAM-dependent methyltransferase [Rhodospirillaceae bacterium]MDD9929380.1 class I SAM-dependent methyltransferase [Rhodospirillaceae bacterium]